MVRASPRLLQILTENSPLYLLPLWLLSCTAAQHQCGTRNIHSSLSHCVPAAPDNAQPLPACGSGHSELKGARPRADCCSPAGPSWPQLESRRPSVAKALFPPGSQSHATKELAQSIQEAPSELLASTSLSSGNDTVKQ